MRPSTDRTAARAPKEAVIRAGALVSETFWFCGSVPAADLEPAGAGFNFRVAPHALHLHVFVRRIAVRPSSSCHWIAHPATRLRITSNIPGLQSSDRCLRVVVSPRTKHLMAVCFDDPRPTKRQKHNFVSDGVAVHRLLLPLKDVGQSHIVVFPDFFFLIAFPILIQGDYTPHDVPILRSWESAAGRCAGWSNEEHSILAALHHL